MAGAALLCAMPVQANLIVNGGFETGALAPWVSGGTPGPTITAVPAMVHAGMFAAQLNPIASLLTQTVPIIGGTSYNLDFWAKANGAGTLVINLDSVTAAPNLVFGVNLGVAYAHYFYTITPTTPGDLTFVWVDGLANSAFIDDVNLTAVPEPTTLIAGALLLLPFAASTLRRLRKNRVA